MYLGILNELLLAIRLGHILYKLPSNKWHASNSMLQKQLKNVNSYYQCKVMYLVYVLHGVRWSHSDQIIKNRQCMKVLQGKNLLHTHMYTRVMFTHKQQVWVSLKACLHPWLLVIYKRQACFIIYNMQLHFNTVYIIYIYICSADATLEIVLLITQT
jgi:hypothetical protein